MASVYSIYRDAYPITKADADLPSAVDAIYIGGAGDVVLTTEGGHSVTIKAPPVGTILPIRTIRVADATTATLLIGLQYQANYGYGVREESLSSSVADELVDDSAAAIFDDRGENIYV